MIHDGAVKPAADDFNGHYHPNTLIQRALCNGSRIGPEKRRCRREESWLVAGLPE
jgi:hypothetical protein